MKLIHIIDTLKRNDLFKNSINLNLERDIRFNHIQTDSRKVESDDIFVCIPGFEVDGHDYAEKAFEKGAALLVVEKELDIDCRQIVVTSSRKACSALANRFYKNPSSKFKLIGITGTNGKTTTSMILDHLFRYFGYNTGVIGTLGHWINGKHYPSERTTPDILELNAILNKMVEADVHFVVMEVSSHAIALDRVFTLDFDMGLFTNLTRDHLDFHKTFENYANTKFDFLSSLDKSEKTCLLFTDDPNGKKFAEKLLNRITISENEGDYLLSDLKYSHKETTFSLTHNNEKHTFSTPLIGRFNALNVTGAVVTFLHSIPDTNMEKLKEAVAEIPHVPGRLQYIKNNKNLNIFIDYAHTPDAILNVLKTLRSLTSGRLITVIGAGGDRDFGKRSEMGRISCKYSDVSIFTSDNPRSENPASIIKDMIKDLEIFDPYWVNQDRAAAIKTAITLASENDIVVIAGKGHENYQEINGIKHHFDDAEEAIKAIEDLKSNYEEQFGENSINLAVPIDLLQLEILYEAENKANINSRQFQSISSDSRTIDYNSLFFTFSGSNFDGHKYLEKVLSEESNFAIISNPEYASQNTLLVKNTVEAYQALAKKYKELFKAKRIALTGSYGKTTTKEYISNVLSTDGNVLKTYKNENNQIGVPKTIFNLTPKHDYAVIELGTNHPGEISSIAECCEPHIGIVTAIGASHLEFFKSIENVEIEKKNILKYTKETKIIPFDLDYENNNDAEVIRFGDNLDADFYYHHVSSENNTVFSLNDRQYTIATSYDKYILNASLAVICGLKSGLSQEKISEGLLSSLKINHRMEISHHNNHHILIDCYNANPDSMLAAIEYWSNYMPELPHVAFLGDMLEMGETASFYHKKIGKILNNYPFEITISVGKESEYFSCSKHFSNVDELLKSNLFEQLPEGAVILVKGSNGIHLEKIIGRL